MEPDRLNGMDFSVFEYAQSPIPNQGMPAHGTNGTVSTNAPESHIRLQKGTMQPFVRASILTLVAEYGKDDEGFSKNIWESGQTPPTVNKIFTRRHALPSNRRHILPNPQKNSLGGTSTKGGPCTYINRSGLF